jgi:hypothetical protein
VSTAGKMGQAGRLGRALDLVATLEQHFSRMHNALRAPPNARTGGSSPTRPSTLGHRVMDRARLSVSGEHRGFRNASLCANVGETAPPRDARAGAKFRSMAVAPHLAPCPAACHHLKRVHRGGRIAGLLLPANVIAKRRRLCPTPGSTASNRPIRSLTT